MRVTYTRRLGQHEAGTDVDVSDVEGLWLVHRGYATTVSTPPVTDDHDDDAQGPTPDSDHVSDHGRAQGVRPGAQHKRRR